MPDTHLEPDLPDTALLARIDALNRLYGHIIDDGEFERWPGLFAEDGLYKITTRWNYDNNMPAGLMNCENRAMMEDRVSALRIANVYEPHTYRHLIEPPMIAGTDDGFVTVWASFVVFRTMQTGAPEIFCTGKYIDKLVEGADEIQFKERIVVCDSERIDTMIVIPL